jgi:hypothetical protein
MTDRIKARDGRGRNITTLQDAQNAMRAAEMRSRSMTYPQIAAEMGIALSTAYDRVQRGFAQIPTEGGKEAKRLELEKLDRIEAHLLGVMERDHIKVDHGKIIYDDTGNRILDDGPGVTAANSLLRVQERRSRLMGYDAPTRATVQVITEDLVDEEISRLESQLAERQDRSATGEIGPAEGTEATASDS